MNARDRAILMLLDDAIETRDAEAVVALWRMFADLQGLNPDFAVVLQALSSTFLIPQASFKREMSF